jgi:hypothetical protein
VIVAHIMGLPIEEGLLPLVPAGAAIVTAAVVVGRSTFGRLRRLARRGL